ncbi:hypothetical protein GF337_04390 [candidate division KSB1 bacterium]|nr:hypothetical protein [candidate division KSB1 bacterium]
MNYVAKVFLVIIINIMFFFPPSVILSERFNYDLIPDDDDWVSVTQQFRNWEKSGYIDKAHAIARGHGRSFGTLLKSLWCYLFGGKNVFVVEYLAKPELMSKKSKMYSRAHLLFMVYAPNKFKAKHISDEFLNDEYWIITHWRGRRKVARIIYEDDKDSLKLYERAVKQEFSMKIIKSWAPDDT